MGEANQEHNLDSRAGSLSSSDVGFDTSRTNWMVRKVAQALQGATFRSALGFRDGTIVTTRHSRRLVIEPLGGSALHWDVTMQISSLT